MGLGTIGAIAGIAAAASSLAATAYAASQTAPNLNTGNASLAAVQEEAQLLPYERLYQSAAQTGGNVTKYGYTQTTVSDQQKAALQQQLASAQGQLNTLQTGLGQDQSGSMVPWAVQQAQQRVANLQSQIAAIPANSNVVYTDSSGNIVPASQAVESFAGYGTANVEGQLAQQQAANQLALQQKYGTAFAQEAANQLALADPQGTQARQELYNLISQNNGPTMSPVAEQLDSQINQQLNAGENLDPMETSVLNSAVEQAQNARGQQVPASTQEFATPLQTGFEGQQRALGRQNLGTSWLASGSTPEDIAYRQQQQQMANLGSFVNGVTPEAQFSNLSGAQTGTAPNYTGQPLMQANNATGTNAASYATAGYLKNLQYQQSQVNGWLGGLSATISAANAAGNAGWQPFASTAGG